MLSVLAVLFGCSSSSSVYSTRMEDGYSYEEVQKILGLNLVSLYTVAWTPAP